MNLVLIKHALPTLDPSKPPKEWKLGIEGESHSKTLARKLDKFLPFDLISSSEPKAIRTAEIISNELGMQVLIVEGLEEFDRPALPIMKSEELVRLNRQIFEDRTNQVIGQECANQALTRFESAVQRTIVRLDESRNLVIVSHGTVISLFVERHNSLSGFDLWKCLECPSYVVLSYPSFKLIEIVERITQRGA